MTKFAFAPGSTPMRPHEVKPTPSVEQSAASVKAFTERKLAKKNWQLPKDPNDFYRRQGSAFAAKESAATAAKRYDPRGND